MFASIRIGLSSSSKGELTSVAQLKSGTIILSFLSLPPNLRAARPRRIADDPELTNTACLEPNQSEYFFSNNGVIGPLVSCGIGRPGLESHSTTALISVLSIVSDTNLTGLILVLYETSLLSQLLLIT